MTTDGTIRQPVFAGPATVDTPPAGKGRLFLDSTDGLVKYKDSAGNVAASGVPSSRTITTTAPLTGGGDLTANRVLAISPASTTAAGTASAVQHLELNALDGRDSSGARKTVFRPADYLVGNTYDPTGTSDSTSSFTAAWNAFVALNDRSTFEIPPGVFKVATNLLQGMGSAPGRIKGSGRGTTVLIPTNGAGVAATTGDFIKLNASADGFEICDLAIYQTSGVPHTAGSAINTNGVDDLAIHDVLFVDQFVDVNVQGSAIKVSIQRTVHSQVNGSATSVGILVTNGLAGDTYIGPDVVMSNTGATRRRASVEVVQSGHFEVNQCNLTGSLYGMLVDPGAGQIVGFGFINETLFDSNTGNGVRLDAVTATSTIKSLTFTNSWFSGTVAGVGGNGFVSDSSGAGVVDGIEFDHCRALNNQTNGYNIRYGTNIRWVGGRASGNSAAAANTSDGIAINAGVSNWSVTGGKYGGTDQASTGGNQRYGISIAAGASDNWSIIGADLTGNNTGPLLNGGTGVSQYVAGCVGLVQPKSLAASVAIANTETVVLSASIPPNSQRVGTTYKITGGGLWSNTAAATTSTLRIRIGTTTLTGNIPQGLTINCGATARTNVPFSFEGKVSIKSLGAGGTCTGYLVINLPNVVAPIIAAVTTAAVAVDTTAVKLLELTFISGLAGNTVTFTDCTITPEVA